jgi:uridylate kinase
MKYGTLLFAEEPLRHLEKADIIFGRYRNPSTTDSAAVLKSDRDKGRCILKGTRVDGIYTADPEKISR